MSTDSAYRHTDSQRLADLKHQTEELERKLSDARMSLERELAQAAWSGRQSSGWAHDADSWALPDMDDAYDPDALADFHVAPEPLFGYGGADPAERPYGGAERGYEPAERAYEPVGRARWPVGRARGRVGRARGRLGQPREPADRTAGLVNHGRHITRRRRLVRGSKLAIVIAVALAFVAIAASVVFNRQPSWPPTVATVQAQAQQACRNPDVRSEPGQVNFTCAQATRQILWVFALMTSRNNPGFADAKNGRVGLEPISPAQGGEVAWSLNLHHPYDPANPVDSLAVAARAINNIIGGATATSASGRPVVQPGLESSPANCLRYTGSAALRSRNGFPSLCARPIVSNTGRATLVADVYQKWVVGAGPKAAQDAAVLFQNADNPGNAQVQAILKRLYATRPAT